MIRRGQIRWADLGEPRGSQPGYRRPVLVVQADSFNRSRIATILATILTSNVELARAPGNVLLPKSLTGLPKDSVANVSQMVTLDRDDLDESVLATLPPQRMCEVDAGLRLVLELGH